MASETVMRVNLKIIMYSSYSDLDQLKGGQATATCRGDLVWMQMWV